MPHFKFRWRYTPHSVQEIVEYPENRTHLIKVLVEDFHGKLLHFYSSFGSSDAFFIAEFPNNATAWACALTSEATDGFDIYEIESLLTPEEGKQAMEIVKNTHSAYFIYRSAIHPQITPGDDTQSPPPPT